MAEVKLDHHLLINIIHEHPHTLYALYDAARDSKLLRTFANSNIPLFCLYAGAKRVTLADVAPYLIPLEYFKANIDWFASDIWGKGVSMLVEGDSVEDLKLQLKKNCYIKNSRGNSCYFRYYDSRAFTRFVRIASVAQLDELFGKTINTFYWQDITTQKIWKLNRKMGGKILGFIPINNVDFDVSLLS